MVLTLRALGAVGIFGMASAGIYWFESKEIEIWDETEDSWKFMNLEFREENNSEQFINH